MNPKAGRRQPSDRGRKRRNFLRSSARRDPLRL